MICFAPVDARNQIIRPVLVALARCIATRSGGNFLDIPEINLEVLDEPTPPPGQSEDYIMKLAAAHQAVVLYLWLSYRMNSIFRSQPLAFHAKSLLQEKLDQALASAKLNRAWLQSRTQRAQAARIKKVLMGGDGGDEEKVDELFPSSSSSSESVGDMGLGFGKVIDVENDGKPIGDGIGYFPPQPEYREEVVRGS